MFYAFIYILIGFLLATAATRSKRKLHTKIKDRHLFIGCVILWPLAIATVFLVIVGGRIDIWVKYINVKNNDPNRGIEEDQDKKETEGE